MAYARMRVICKDALICDFAQYYNIYDMNNHDLQTMAILACGLPPESRTIRQISGQKYSAEMIVQMGILDTLRSIENVYINVHSKRKIPKPKSIFEILNGNDEKEIRVFRSGEEFERERERLIRGN